MRYMLLIGSDDKMQDQAPPPKAQMDAMVQAHMRFAEELSAKGKMVAADRLRPDSDARRVRLKAGQRQVMDGPFAETKEALGGFYVIATRATRPIRARPSCATTSAGRRFASARSSSS